MNKMNLDEFKKYIYNRKILCFGCGIQGKRMAAYLENWGLDAQLIAYIDNSQNKIGTIYYYHDKKYPILSLKSAEEQYGTDCIILVTCLDFRSIYKQIEAESNYREYVSIDEISDNQLMDSDYNEVIKESDQQLIPKKIHYAWFGDKKPDKIKSNIENWKKMCPDYDFYEWNDSNYDITVNKYMKQAYEQKKWGFVPDYLRLDVIYQEGGIYLDTDIQMLKRPDELLYQKCFACTDASLTMNLGSGFGATKNTEIIKLLRDYYDNVEFVHKDGTIDNTSCNSHSFQVLEKFGYKITDKLQCIHGMNIYPMIFQGAAQHTRRCYVTNKTFWIHYGDMSWLDKRFDERLINNLTPEG